jgi:hypothetical protein
MFTYTKVAIKHVLSLRDVEGNWKVHVTRWTLALFYLLDIPIVELSFGKWKVYSHYHTTAFFLWFDEGLLDLALEDDPRWGGRLRGCIAILLLK